LTRRRKAQTKTLGKRHKETDGKMVCKEGRSEEGRENEREGRPDGREEAGLYELGDHRPSAAQSLDNGKPTELE
jgi:hypothetical protein